MIGLVNDRLALDKNEQTRVKERIAFQLESFKQRTIHFHYTTCYIFSFVYIRIAIHSIGLFVQRQRIVMHVCDGPTT